MRLKIELSGLLISCLAAFVSHGNELESNSMLRFSWTDNLGTSGYIVIDPLKKIGIEAVVEFSYVDYYGNPTGIGYLPSSFYSSEDGSVWHIALEQEGFWISWRKPIVDLLFSDPCSYQSNFLSMGPYITSSGDRSWSEIEVDNPSDPKQNPCSDGDDEEKNESRNYMDPDINSALLISWNAVVGESYVIESSSDLKSWNLEFSTSARSSSMTELIPVDRSSSSTFFRIYSDEEHEWLSPLYVSDRELLIRSSPSIFVSFSDNFNASISFDDPATYVHYIYHRAQRMNEGRLTITDSYRSVYSIILRFETETSGTATVDTFRDGRHVLRQIDEFVMGYHSPQL